MKRIFPIEEFRNLAAIALDQTDYEPADSARVRAVPDVRTIRYYTTLGIIDRPAEMRGRTALYGLKHVQQLVAIKRLQADGLTLSDIQQRLLGLPKSKLKKLAALPEDLEAVAAKQKSRLKRSAKPQATQPVIEPPVGEAEFWKELPEAKNHSATEQTSGATAHSDRSSISQILKVELSPSVTLEIKISALPAQRVDLSAIQQSSQALIAELKRQNLAPRGNQ